MHNLYRGIIIMKNTKKLDAINQKIADLQKAKDQLENDYINDISKDIRVLGKIVHQPLPS